MSPLAFVFMLIAAIIILTVLTHQLLLLNSY